MISNLVLSIFSLFFMFTNEKPAYNLFDKEANKSNYDQMLDECLTADVVLFGELHNNPISHWLQFELTKDIYAKKKHKLALGAEMFEADNQLIIDEYFNGYITQKKFEEEARLWNNYQTDYKPLLEFANENKLKFVATNIPRRYANTVFKQGLKKLDELSLEAKKFIAPLPIEVDLELNCYKQLVEGMQHMGANAGKNMAHAQAVKDATMAHFILQNYKKGQIFIHYNGAYHSDNFESIYWYLQKQNPDLKIVTISTVNQKKIDKLEKENKGIANFIICTPETMTGTY